MKYVHPASTRRPGFSQSAARCACRRRRGTIPNQSRCRTGRPSLSSSSTCRRSENGPGCRARPPWPSPARRGRDEVDAPARGRARRIERARRCRSRRRARPSGSRPVSSSSTKAGCGLPMSQGGWPGFIPSKVGRSTIRASPRNYLPRQCKPGRHSLAEYVLPAKGKRLGPSRRITYRVDRFAVSV